MVTRIESWPVALNHAVDTARHKPFCWGYHDCAQFAAGVVKAMTGVDFAASFRGRYRTRREAVAAIKAAGFRSLEDIATAKLGESIEPRLAQRGDVVLIHTPEGNALGICTGVLAVAPGPDGLTFVEPGGWRKAWRV